MVKLLPRLLLGFTALLLTFGGLTHASAFKAIQSAIAASDLAPFAANSLRLLWLADTETLITVAAIFGFVAVWPSAAARPVLLLLALVPAATAVLIYTFIGSFAGGHILTMASVAALLGGLQYPRTNSSSPSASPGRSNP